ncbi:peptidoglycan binding protein CsiV [Psychromonas hadalis]|uniref:peptidoglycan binding protein CsiV n=1 Tax=Psychromonas hadalis TaxID=211669 RepID=UPI0003B43ED2|nr:peptidoglycan binding protein CsiV [Psychromonas hadalis]
MNYKTLVALFLSVASLSVQAEQRWFEVELLMFQRNVEMKDIKEHLSSQEIVINTDNSINLLKPATIEACIVDQPCLHKKNPVVITNAVFDSAGNNFQRLDNSHLQLVEQRKKLEKHHSFKPVFHMVWRMPMESGRTAKPIHLFAGNNLAFNIQKRQQAKIAPASSDPISTEVFDSELDTELIETEEVPLLTDKWAIDGNFNIYLDHYLFIDSQLIIRKEISEEIQQVEMVVEMIDDENGVQIATQSEAEAVVNEVKQQTVIKEILFDQKRRLRSGEVHYLDHPLMGIIVQIRKIPK